MLIFLSSLLACQVMDSPGQVFAAVQLEQGNNVDASNVDGNATGELKSDVSDPSTDSVTDPLFEDPQADVIEVGGEEAPSVEPNHQVNHESEDTSKDAVVSDGTSEPGHEVAHAVHERVAESSVVPVLNAMRPATVKDGWRPTLIGTLMDGPTPRAILALPSGEEKVIKAGDMLSDDGVVVMAIGTNFVELAVVRHAEGRAQIENLTLSAQF